MAVLMLIFAVGVALAIAILPSHYAILAVFGLACLCYCFNRYYKANKTVIATGQLLVQSGVIIHDGQRFVFNNPTVQISEDRLIITSANQELTIQGFDNAKEMSIAKAVLLGHPIHANKVAVKMGGSS